MKIADLFPSPQQWEKLRDVETSLRRRRAAGTVAGFVAIVSAVLQVVLLLADSGYLEKVIGLLSSVLRLRFDELAALELDSDRLLAWLVLLAAIAAYLLLRRTGFLLRESKEPFRYTFWITPFARIESTPRERFHIGGEDRFALLHHDLTERLNQRIRRFSISQEGAGTDSDEGAPRATDSRSASHIHISGHWVVREEGDDQWVVQVTPLIRIGSRGSAARLAMPVRFPLNRIDPANGAAYELRADEYTQIIERVYSRIATEVYAQLDADVREKIRLFPTARLRAVALYHEAEDFAASNTVDAYKRAIDLYKDAMRYFQLLDLQRITRGLLRVPWLVWRLDLRFHHQWAQIVTGYARCLVYRRQMSELAGRPLNPLYELPELIDEAIDSMQILHKRIARAGDTGRLAFLKAAIHYPRDTWAGRVLGRSSGPLFEIQKKRLLDLYIVDALVRFFLGNMKHTVARLHDARAVSPDTVERDPLFALILGLVEPEPDKRIVHYRQAVDLAPNFQMARWNLASAYETEFRRRDELTWARARRVIDTYEDLLKINYGNISALSSQGFVMWLIGDPDAASKFEEGREVKVIARETFTGELDYRLARIAAERGEYDACFEHYMEAKEADPSVGTYYPGKESRIDMTDYENLSGAMLQRFRTYSEGVAASVEAQRRASDGRYTPRTLNTVLCFVLNDYGNACLRYFHYHGDRSQLEAAITAYEKAIAANPKDAVPWFNVQNAYGWIGEWKRIAGCYEQARRLAPSWSAVAIKAAQEHVTTLSTELREQDKRIDKAQAALAQQQQRLYGAQSELNEVQTELRRLQQRRGQGGAARQSPLYTIDAAAVQRLEQQQARMDQRLRELPAGLIEALRKIAGQGAASEEAIIDKLEAITGKPLNEAQRFTLRTRLLTSTDIAEMRERWVQDGDERRRLDLQAREQVLKAKIKEGHKDVDAQQKDIERLLEKRSTLATGFAEGLQAALERISANSRLGPLFEGELEARIDRLIAVPWSRLDGNDVETLTVRAEVLALAGDDPACLRAAMRLGRRLLDMLPETHRVVTLLKDVVPKLIEHEKKKGSRRDDAYLASLDDTLHRADAALRTIVDQWVHFEPGVFLALYWFLSVEDFADPVSLERVRKEHFKGEDHEFDNLLGHVYLTIGRVREATEAYRRAVAQAPGDAKSQYFLGKACQFDRNWQGARAAFARAHRLEPGEPAYRLSLAGIYNRLGVEFHNAAAYRDAIDNYEQAIALDSTQALYHANLSRAWEQIDNADRGSAIEAALHAMQAALALEPDSEPNRSETERLRRRLAGGRVYGNATVANFLTVVTPLAVEYAANLDPLIRGDAGGEVSDATAQRVEDLREGLAFRFGIRMPRVRWRSNATDLPEGMYILMLSEIPLVSGTLRADCKLCLHSVAELRQRGIEGSDAVDPLSGERAAWLDSTQWAAAEAAGMQLLDALSYLFRHLSALISRNLVELLGQQEVVNMLQSSRYADIAELATDARTVDSLTEVLQALAMEQVPLLAFENIVNCFLALIDIEGVERTIEEIRMLSQVRPHLPGNSAQSTFICLADDFEALLEGSILEQDGNHILAMEPEVCQQALSAIRQAAADVARPALVVREPGHRIHLRKLVELEFPDLPVLAQRELLEELAGDGTPACPGAARLSLA